MAQGTMEKNREKNVYIHTYIYITETLSVQ